MVWREVSHEERSKNEAGPQSELDHGKGEGSRLPQESAVACWFITR